MGSKKGAPSQARAPDQQTAVVLKAFRVDNFACLADHEDAVAKAQQAAKMKDYAKHWSNRVSAMNRQTAAFGLDAEVDWRARLSHNAAMCKAREDSAAAAAAAGGSKPQPPAGVLRTAAADAPEDSVQNNDAEAGAAVERQVPWPQVEWVDCGTILQVAISSCGGMKAAASTAVLSDPKVAAQILRKVQQLHRVHNDGMKETYQSLGELPPLTDGSLLYCADVLDSVGTASCSASLLRQLLSAAMTSIEAVSRQTIQYLPPADALAMLQSAG